MEGGSELKNKFGCCYIRDEEKMKEKNEFVRYNIQNYTIYTHNTPKRERERVRGICLLMSLQCLV